MSTEPTGGKADSVKQYSALTGKTLKSVKHKEPAVVRAGSNSALPSSTSKRTFASRRGRFKGTIQAGDRKYAYDRDEIVHRTVDKGTIAPFNKWYNPKLLTSDPEKREKEAKFIEAIRSIEKQCHLQRTMWLVWRLGKVQKNSYLGISYLMNENGTSNASVPATKENVFDIYDTVPITNDRVRISEKIEEDGNVRWGQAEMYTVSYTGNDSSTSSIKVHASRMMNIIPLPWDDSLDGMSIIDSIYDKFVSKKDLDWHTALFAKKHVHPFAEITHPDTDEAEAWVQSNFPNGVEGKDYISHSDSEEWAFEFHSPKDTVDLNALFSNTTNPLASGLAVPLNLAFGDFSGTSGGSESSLQSFFNDITAEQNIVISPMIRDFHKRMFETGVLKKHGWDGDYLPDYEIDWREPFELTGKELAQKQRLTAIALGELTKKGIYTINMALKEIGQPPSTNPLADEHLYEGVKLELRQEAALPPEPEEPPDEEEETPEDLLTPEEKDEKKEAEDNAA